MLLNKFISDLAFFLLYFLTLAVRTDPTPGGSVLEFMIFDTLFDRLLLLIFLPISPVLPDFVNLRCAPPPPPGNGFL